MVWRCPVRTKDIPYCPAIIKQIGINFVRGPKQHLHEATRGAETVAVVRREIKVIKLNLLFVIVYGWMVYTTPILSQSGPS